MQPYINTTYIYSLIIILIKKEERVPEAGARCCVCVKQRKLSNWILGDVLNYSYSLITILTILTILTIQTILIIQKNRVLEAGARCCECRLAPSHTLP